MFLWPTVPTTPSEALLLPTKGSYPNEILMGKVLHASKSGYFPTCIVEGEPENCPWTLEKAMQTYWRVRTWDFEASGVIRFDEDEEPPYNFPFSSTITDITSHDFQTDVPQTLEEGLVCGNYFEFFGELRYYANIVFGQAETSGGLYNSGLEGNALDYTTEPLEFVFASNISSAFNISILGTNIPIAMNYNNDEDNQGVTGTIISGSATLTPTLWWSYGGKYDPATGNPL